MPNRQRPTLHSFYAGDLLISSVFFDDPMQGVPASHDEDASQIVDEPFFFDPPYLN